MIPNIVKHGGLSDALAYCMSEGYEAERLLGKQQYAEAKAAGIDTKGAKVQLAEGEASRATILGGQNFGFEIDSPERSRARPQGDGMGGLAAEPEPAEAGSARRIVFTLRCRGSTASSRPPTRCARPRKVFSRPWGWKRRMRFLSRMTTKSIRTSTLLRAGLTPKRGGRSRRRMISPNAQSWALHYEREHGQPQSEKRQELHKLLDAVEARNGVAVADLLTERSPTFTARELDKALMLARMTPDARAKFRS